MEILIIDGMRLHSTWRPESKDAALQAIQDAAEYGETLVLRDYGVDIHTCDPKTNEVLSWDRGGWNYVAGYSLWE